MEVYVDILMLLNFLVDFLLLVGTNRLSGHPPGFRRALLGALLGGLYAGACVLPGFDFLAGTLWRLVSLALMSVITFGTGQSALRRGVLFVFLSMALGGIALGLGKGGFWSLVLASCGVCALCLVGFRGRAGGQEYAHVTICHGGRELSLTALMDTGNTLLDPITGCPVLVADAASARRLLDLDAAALASPLETMALRRQPGLRLIPYSAVGQKAGLLLAIRPDSVQFNGKKAECIVAFAPQSLGQGRFQALAGGVL